MDAFESAFHDFLSVVRINSKERGQIILGDHVYRAQKILLDNIFDGLSEDIHDFKILKSRQLGISTLSRAMTMFWIGIHDGLKGYMIFDTDGHKEEARLELLGMVEGLPQRFDFPRIKRHNRYLLELSNGSIMNFASAGVRQGKSSGVLGRSSGVNFCHASEMCSWDNTEGLESFKNALAEEFQDRLYIWESTARGYNQWHEMWEEARADPTHQRCVFIGWWAKDNQQIAKEHPDFAKYMRLAITPEEKKKIETVERLYGWKITPEQIAWIRRKTDPGARANDADGDASDFEQSVLQVQEQPWTEEEAFQQTGATFFHPDELKAIEDKFVSRKFKPYSYMSGVEFTHTRIYPAHNVRSTELKVWNDPIEAGGSYVLAADPAFGANERNDRSAIQVMRAYADGLDQVAEYAWPLVNTRQFAWVIASLLGWYGGVQQQNDVGLMLEINGPGEAVWNELQSLKARLAYGYVPQADEMGLRNIYQNVKNYLYQRSDAFTPGTSLQWKTQTQLKIAILERMRDLTGNGTVIIRSHDTVQEMQSIAREGDSISATGKKKDDRVIALALAIRFWEDKMRKGLMARRITRESEAARERMSIRDQIALFNTNQLETFFVQKRRESAMAQMALRRASWRGNRYGR